MPTYEYRCAACGRDLEVVQKFDDPPLTVCPDCQGALHKVFSPVGIVFKGSGFYATDSQRSASSASPAGPHASAGPTTSAASESAASTPSGAASPAPSAAPHTPAASTPASTGATAA